MPLYFFNAICGEEGLVDPHGQDSDEDAAWDVARDVACALMDSKLSNPVDWPLTTLEVVAESGEVVLELPFLEACK